MVLKVTLTNGRALPMVNHFFGRGLGGFARKMQGMLLEFSQAKRRSYFGYKPYRCNTLATLHEYFQSIDPNYLEDSNHDRFIPSQGDVVNLLRVAMAYRNFFIFKLIEEYSNHGGSLLEHHRPECIETVEFAAESNEYGFLAYKETLTVFMRLIKVVASVEERNILFRFDCAISG
ncbi:MAG: hypothetical protein CFH10_01264 [Alphaproteobacteria bacterium MarineAlpha4_Bin2]|nr:MAG: hypothetical protein CFH10_01264 [Alphaproteobacteria bacterium MarineAlpha4_Bin2]